MQPDFEALRQRYRPQEVRVLFVGESIPAGGTFFYAGNSVLFRATRDAFSLAYNKEWHTAQEFLEFFKAQGCFLVDLCSSPVNKLDDLDRERTRCEGIPLLAQQIAAVRPAALVVVMLAIGDHARAALECAAREHGRPSRPLYELPFPRPEHHKRYQRELSELLARLKSLP